MTATEKYLKLWCLSSDAEPFRTATSTVQFVRQNGKPCVLKIARARGDEATSHALSHFAGCGAVKLLAHDGLATLMQRAAPGTPLSSLVIAGSDDEATQHVCRTMTALHGGDLPTDEFSRIEDWGAAFTRPAAQAVPRPLVDKASRIYADLCRSQKRRVLLHGDLHHDNILFDAEDGWLAIDPKGVIGESDFEAGAALRNPTEDSSYFASPEIIDRRVRIMCEMMGWRRERVLNWCFSQAVLSAIWSLEDKEDPTRGLTVATAALTLI